MTDQARLTVSGVQADFLDQTKDTVAIFGAKGSGKTYVGTVFLLSMIQHGGQGLVMLNTLQQARDIWRQNIKPMLDSLGWPYIFNEAQLMLLVWDTIVHFRAAERDVVKRIESIEYSWGWADEASYYEPESLRTFMSRIRKGKALKRITSMPADPEAFIYNFIDGREGATVHEISLSDNPDQAFRERYEKELRATYSGAMLDRYLLGRRVSLTGHGLFHVDPSMRQQVGYDPAKPLILSWDFNVAYRAVTGWQQIGISEASYPVWACVFSRQMMEPTVGDDARMLAKELARHSSELIITGDASGSNRTAMATGSMWTAIKQAFAGAIQGDIVFRVPNANPLVRDTIECANWALRNGLVTFDEDQAKGCYNSLVAAKADKYGDIDKSQDYKDSTVKSHEADTARYALWQIYSGLYPGTNKRYFVV